MRMRLNDGWRLRSVYQRSCELASMIYPKLHAISKLYQVSLQQCTYGAREEVLLFRAERLES